MIEEAAIEVNRTMEPTAEPSPCKGSEPIAEPKPCGLVLSDAETQAVIQTVEPIVNKCKGKAVIRPKSINLFRDQQLNVKLENGVTLSLNFEIPEN